MKESVETKRTNKVKRVYLYLNCLFEFYAGITGATFILFLYSNNLDTMETNLIVASSLITAFFMEIPTGALADYLGYVKTTFLMGVLLCITNIIFLFGNTIPLFLVAQICLGIACAFESGTLDAWVIENTSHKDSEYIFVKKNKAVSIIMIVAGFFGGVVADFCLEGIFLLALIAALIFVILSILAMPKLQVNVKKRQKYSVSENINEMKKIVGESFLYCIKDKNIRNIILFNGILMFAFSPIFVFWSPVLHDFQYVNYTVIGMAWILMRGFMLLGNMVLEKWIHTTFLTLSIVSIVCGGCIIGLAFLKQFWTFFIGILIFEFLLGLIYPLKETVLNVGIESANRATILSFNSLVACLLNYVSMILMGKLAAVFSIEMTWICSGTILIIISIITLVPNIKRSINRYHIDLK